MALPTLQYVFLLETDFTEEGTRGRRAEADVMSGSMDAQASAAARVAGICRHLAGDVDDVAATGGEGGAATGTAAAGVSSLPCSGSHAANDSEAVGQAFHLEAGETLIVSGACAIHHAAVRVLG